MSSERQMMRGKAQSLYKYLPESWIDFSIRGNDRKQYIAQVDHWNSEKLDGINSKRLIRTVNHAVQLYMAQGHGGSSVPPTSGFGAELTPENCDVLTPKVSDVERGIVAKISPLTFYCKKCKKVYQFASEESYNRNRCCRNCHIELSQFRQIYFCKCGYATAQHPRCLIHGVTDLYWDSEYNFTCRSCQKKIPMQAKCKDCGTMLGAKVALDPSQFFTYSLSLIDLIDEKLERFISETDYGKYVTIAYFLGKITRQKLDDVIDKGITTDPEAYARQYEANFQMFMNAFHNEETAAVAAKSMTDANCGNEYTPIIEEIKGKLFATEENINQLAEMILEHSMVKELKDHATLETAINLSEEEILRIYGKRWSVEVFFKTCKSMLNLGSECHCLSYDALTAHVSLVFIRYMLLSLQQRNNCDDRTISELFLLMIDELADISFGHALQLIVDIMLQMIQERFGLSDAQLDEFVTSFIERLPISYQHALRLKGA